MFQKSANRGDWRGVKITNCRNNHKKKATISYPVGLAVSVKVEFKTKRENWNFSEELQVVIVLIIPLYRICLPLQRIELNFNISTVFNHRNPVRRVALS